MGKMYRVRVGVQSSGWGLQAWQNDMKEAQRRVKREVSKSAKDRVKDVISDAKSDATSKQQPAVAKSLKSDLFKGKPSVSLGGRKQVIKVRGKKRPVLAGELAIGAEFGSTRYTQFPARSAKLGQGNVGYFFYPSVRKNYQKVLDDYQAELRRIFK
jgi:hypothetical protein